MKVQDKSDSVLQICSECEQIIQKAEEAPYINIEIAISNLRSSLDSLRKVFDETPGDTAKITTLKAVAEKNAIILEELCYHQLGLYEERVKLRRFADKFFIDVRDIFEEVSKTADQSVIFKWAHIVNWALMFYAQSKHILFTVDEEDQEYIKSCTRDITAYLETHNQKMEVC